LSDPSPLAQTAIADPQGGTVPNHVAIIMDGNGRWAKARGLPRAAGHERAYVKRDLKRLKREGVRIRIIGSRDGLPEDITALIARAERETEDNDRAHLTIAFNYGGREEIARAAKKLALEVSEGRLKPEEIDVAKFESALDTFDIPPPDLLVRTSGEFRISNFLLWQVAYSEIVILDVLWPEFDVEHLNQVVADFAGRDRRFGALSEGAA